MLEHTIKFSDHPCLDQLIWANGLPIKNSTRLKMPEILNSSKCVAMKREKEFAVLDMISCDQKTKMAICKMKGNESKFSIMQY